MQAGAGTSPRLDAHGSFPAHDGYDGPCHVRRRQTSGDATNLSPDEIPALSPRRFYSADAGYKDPRDSHGAWCALREGLDYTDTQRFPEAKFGEVGRGENAERYHAIAKAMAAYGARQSPTGVTRRTDWKGMDDVGFEIFRGNYELYLHQIEPEKSSVGLWRVGPKDQFHGRFARRFDHASGRDAMHFQIAEGFFDGPLNGKYPVQVRVVYFDEGKGKWALTYDAAGNPRKTGIEVPKTGTNRWKEVTLTIADGCFTRRGPMQSDLSLVSLDGEDDTFHMVELTRTTGDRKGHWGD